MEHNVMQHLHSSTLDSATINSATWKSAISNSETLKQCNVNSKIGNIATLIITTLNSAI